MLDGLGSVRLGGNDRLETLLERPQRAALWSALRAPKGEDMSDFDIRTVTMDAKYQGRELPRVGCRMSSKTMFNVARVVAEGEAE